MGWFVKKTTKNKGAENSTCPPIYIKQINITNSRDFLVLRQNLQEGNIMVCNITSLFASPNRNMEARQKSFHYLEQLKQFCIKTGGSISKLEDHVLLITPDQQIKIQS